MFIINSQSFKQLINIQYPIWAINLPRR